MTVEGLLATDAAFVDRHRAPVLGGQLFSTPAALVVDGSSRHLLEQVESAEPVETVVQIVDHELQQVVDLLDKLLIGIVVGIAEIDTLIGSLISPSALWSKSE